MRKTFISIAAAGAALIAASPAAAQYYPQPQPYAYGYQNNWGQVRALQVRLNNVERQINRLDRRDRVGDRSADRLRREAAGIERRLHDRARGGLDYREARDIEFRITRLEQNVHSSLAYGYGRYGYNSGYNGQFVDRDRDGRNDRYEDDQGREHD